MRFINNFILIILFEINSDFCFKHIYIHIIEEIDMLLIESIMIFVTIILIYSFFFAIILN